MKKTKFIAAALAVLFVLNTYAIPRSKAVVIEATAAFGAAAVTSAINGTTAATLFTGMGTSAATGSVIGLMDTYAVATGVAASGTALASSIATGILVSGGVLLVGAASAALIGGFIDWLREEKGLEAGGESVVAVHKGGFTGTAGFLPVDIFSGDDFSYETGSITWYPMGTTVGPVTSTDTINYTISYNGHAVCTGSGCNYFAIIYRSDSPSSIYFPVGNWVGVSSDFPLGVDFIGIGSAAISTLVKYGMSSTLSEDELDLQPKPEFTEIPVDIPDGQLLTINTGISTLPQDDPQFAADLIMQSAIDGVLDPIVSVEIDPTITPDPDPDPEPLPPPEDLPQNLPELGDVLISRFPFSIPWDIGRVLDFLSAEPVAPHIDFQPFKGDLFGIPAGSVSVDYDFSKHEDIAAFCRTFEIVGFCLLLAVGTKRLIWTA